VPLRPADADKLEASLSRRLTVRSGSTPAWSRAIIGGLVLRIGDQ